MSETSSTGWIMRLGALGDRPEDGPAQRLQHRLLIYMAVLMSGGAVLWGSIALSNDLFLPAVIPAGYTLATLGNLLYFHASKNFPAVQGLQVSLSLLLPFLFQWTLGGFAASGAVMLWAMIAIVGALTFSSSRRSLSWLLLYIALTIVSGLLDPAVRPAVGAGPPESVRTLFFTVNIAIISCCMFGLMIYLLLEREKAAVALERANRRITELNEALGDEVLARTVELRAALSRAEASDRMKSDFVATVSHELRTPLTSVLGFAKLAKTKVEQSVSPHVPATDAKAQRTLGQVRGNLDIIVSEGQRLASLIDDLLDISKMEAGSMTWRRERLRPSELVARAHEVTAALFEGTGVALRTEVEQDLPELEGDFERLLQVLLNLVSNAVKFTPEGSVTLRARHVGGAVELSVTDTGVGIDLPDQTVIFDKFKQVGDLLTNKPRGTGLGLPICRQIVEAHGGSLGVESALGQGASFRAVLPLRRASEPPATEASRALDGAPRAGEGRPGGAS